MNLVPSGKLLINSGEFFKRVLAGDQFRFSLTAIVISFAIFPLKATAHVDLSVGSFARTYPLSGVVTAEAGYNVLLWGTPNTPFSGYLRPRVEGSSSVQYNSGDAAIEFFPLAFLGVRAGGESIQNDRRYSAHDCDTYRCEGRFYRTYFESQLALGAGPVFIIGRFRRERWTQSQVQDMDFMDPTSALAMSASGESQSVLTGAAGINFTEAWSLLGFVRYAQSDSDGFSRFPIGLIRYRHGGLTIAVGGGVFESTLKKNSSAGVLQLSWEISPSLALR